MALASHYRKIKKEIKLVQQRKNNLFSEDF